MPSSKMVRLSRILIAVLQMSPIWTSDQSLLHPMWWCRMFSIKPDGTACFLFKIAANERGKYHLKKLFSFVIDMWQSRHYLSQCLFESIIRHSLTSICHNIAFDSLRSRAMIHKYTQIYTHRFSIMCCWCCSGVDLSRCWSRFSLAFSFTYTHINRHTH